MLFSDLQAAGDEAQFHPHPLVPAEAARLASYSGEDLYYIVTEGPRVLAYGMLRGWDAGFEVPSLGISVHPAERGAGLGKMLMEFLHAAARRKGASQIRLKVYPANTAALRLYRDLGYEFGAEEEGQLVGVLQL